MKKVKQYLKIDYQIRAPEVRVIGADGKQLGIMSKDKALEESRKANLSLVEIAPNAKPPVVRIVDLGKFKYQEEKKQREQQKKAKSSELKEVRFSPFIAENDYQNRLDRAKEFLGENNKVRLVVVFKGPQLRSRQFGYDLFKRVLELLGDNVVVDMQPKFLGRHLVMVISPIKKTKKEKDTTKENNAKTENKKSTS